MAPDAVASTTYSILKDRDVLDFLKEQTSFQRDVIRGVIDDLQFNPRPQGHLVDKTIGYEIIRIIVDGTEPKYILRYIIEGEKERIRVIAIMPMRFPGVRA